MWDKAHGEYKHTESLGNDFHVYGLIWTEDRIMTYFDDEDNVVMDVDMKNIDNWTRCNFPDTEFNPWKD